jgi:hypothetical protein
LRRSQPLRTAKNFCLLTTNQQTFNFILESIRSIRVTIDSINALNANSGRPAPTAAAFVVMPPPNNVNSRNFPNRGRQASRSRTPNPSYVPVTLTGGRALPNSEAKLAAHGKARGNGNINLIDLNPDSNPDTYVQHRECARSPGSQLPSPTTANPNGQANNNSVLQTTNQTLAHQATQLAHQAPQIQELNNEFLLAYNSLIPNSEFARLHQQMIQERRQQQQLAREEAAKLKERVDTALAKAIGWAIAHQPGVAPTPVSAKPGLAAAQQQPGKAALLSPYNPEKAVLSSPNNPEKVVLSSHNISLVAPLLLSRPSLA